MGTSAHWRTVLRPSKIRDPLGFRPPFECQKGRRRGAAQGKRTDLGPDRTQVEIPTFAEASP